MLSLEGLVRTHEGAKAPSVDGVSLTIGEGEILVVVGPSGCGKSSVLRMIAGLDAPSSGRVVLGGTDLARVPPEARDVAMVFQGYALYPHLTARGNMEFPLRMRGVAKAVRREKVERAARLLEIDALLDRGIHQLSGGERQRVAMGRAIVREPKVFLFDEPLSNLDAALRATLRTELATLLRELRATAIYVTHDQSEAMTIGHRVAVMRAGRVEQVGTAREVYESPATRFVASFLGSPEINVLPIARVADGRAEGGAAPSAVDVAFRPEACACVAGDAPDDEGAYTWRGTLTLVEPLGSESVLHVDADGAMIRVREHGFSARSVGERVSLVVPRGRCRFFDREGRAC
ncbi:MAG: ABC transporter ATP-binding protein [Polyangiaceae bacterium]